MSRKVAPPVWLRVIVVLATGCHQQTTETSAPSGAPVAGGVFVPKEITVSLDDSANGAFVPIDAVFANRGTEPLILENVRTSCACTVAGDLPTSRLMPGEETAIPIEVIPPPHGTKTARVEVVTDPPSSGAVLMITAHGRPRQPPFIDEAPHLVTLVHSRGTPFCGTAPVACVEPAGTPPWITATSTGGRSPEALKVSIQPVGEPVPSIIPGCVRRTYEVLVQGPESPTTIASFDVALVADGNDHSDPLHIIRFEVEWVDLVRCVPEIIRGKMPLSDRQRSRHAFLTFATPDHWSATLVSTPPEWLVVEIEKPSETPISRLAVRLQLAEPSVMPSSTDVVFSVTSPERDAIRVSLPVSLTAE